MGRAHPEHRLTDHDPDLIPRELVGADDGRPVLRFSTDSLRSTAGDLEAMALYAGQGRKLRGPGRICGRRGRAETRGWMRCEFGAIAGQRLTSFAKGGRQAP